MMMKHSPKVVVGMSGGVDSSAAAALLVQQGYDVTGVMLRLWSEPGEEDSNRCCTPDAMGLARRVSAQLDIPFYVLDAKGPFKEHVVEGFIRGYARGVTPNPCLICNRQIRWGFLLDYARSMKADYLATGHYARVRRAENGRVELLKGKDVNKDQSYVLSVLTQEQLAHSLLPLGELTKPEVRQLARDLGLVVAERAESQDLCFLGGNDYRGFLSRHAPEVNQPGEIRDRQGCTLGRHQGLAFYTIGQRKGIGIAAAEPYYVVEKNETENLLIVGPLAELGRRRLLARDTNWIDGQAPSGSFRAQVKIRYKAQEAAALIEILAGDRFRITFDQDMRDITPGQMAVVYDGEICRGSGMIESVD
jgi:tRNA-specific 2-thiouridylase